MYKFASPSLLVLFGLAFFAIWLYDRTYRYLLKLSLGFLLFGAALGTQLAGWPSDAVGANTMMSGILYTAGALVTMAAVRDRSGISWSIAVNGAWMIGIPALLAYFFYADNQLITRIYILNFGIAAIFLATAWSLRALRRGPWVDQLMFWMLIILGIHFFPRTIFTVLPGIDPARFAESSFWGWVLFSSAILGAAGGLGLLAIIGADTMRKLRRERDTDLLTGVLNRRGLEQHIPYLEHEAHTVSICLVVCDIDSFKQINDTFGHNVGDVVLANVAKTLLHAVRPDDLVARHGGDEFILILRDMTLVSAYNFADRIRREISAIRFATGVSIRSVTSSFGVAALRPGERFWDAVNRADATTYASKKSGRNRTSVEGMQTPEIA